MIQISFSAEGSSDQTKSGYIDEANSPTHLPNTIQVKKKGRKAQKKLWALIIKPVKERMEVISPMVIVLKEKQNSIRICVIEPSHFLGMPLNSN